jgi:hypothetical protein
MESPLSVDVVHCRGRSLGAMTSGDDSSAGPDPKETPRSDAYRHEAHKASALTAMIAASP